MEDLLQTVLQIVEEFAQDAGSSRMKIEDMKDQIRQAFKLSTVQKREPLTSSDDSRVCGGPLFEL
jgi:hypothetical protein